ncbi:MAG: hypothetical protein IJA69_05650, partial [Clostridia bacterium]|nr:hypothetical protein [Clostridia bacterium]
EVNESGYYVRNEEISFFTNQAVSLFWNEKDSKAKTYAYYKYIPLVERAAAYTDSELKQFYSKYNVPTNYYFDYDPANPLTQINYQNSSTFTEYIPASNILNQNGMYIFRIYDEAGNEKFVSFVIDKTSAPILQMINGEYVDSSDLNILSNDVSVHFGKKRVTQFKNISYSSGAYVAQDQWLQLALNQTASENIALLLINTNSSHYITADINNKVLVSESTTYFHNLTEENGYAYEIAFKQQNSNTAIEKQYNFYTRDAINTQKLAANATEASVYKELYSNFLSLKISSDASLTELYYYKANGLRQFLSTDNSFTNQTDNQKNIYYKPTTLSTLSSSNEILYLNFFPTPEEGNLEIAEVTYSYQPFKETIKYEPSTTNVAYTYAFEQLPENYSPIVIYSKASPENNLTKVGQDGSLIWEVQKEYSSLLAGYQTKAGKYTITRKYDTTLAGYASSVSNKLDFEIRTLTFIVDRNGIITAPVVVDEATGETSNYVGESIKIQVLDSNTADTKVMFFEDIYLASNMSGGTDGLQAILSTNKLPVQVYVPTFKYGYSYTNGGAFNSENSINSYNNSKIIETYQLNAEIRYSAELPGLATTSTIYYGQIDTNSSLNYLVFNENGRSFTNVGFYQVIIKQGNEVNDRNTFSFIFQITESTPDFSLNTVDDLALNQGSDGLYYTNKEKVRLEWVDPSNQFMANINKSKIAYQINNGAQKFIDKDLIRTSGQINTYDLDLNEIGAYRHGTKVTITMQFEGEEKNYNTGYFKTSKTFVIDTVAPTENINNLVSKTGVEYNQLRNVTTKYNTSVNSGVYKYYAYNVTAENFESYINLNSDQLSEIGYRVFVTEEGNNTKYNDIYAQESDPSIVENSTTNFTSLTATTLPYLLNNISQYIEIYEKDLAGNVTIYTIFLSSTDSLVQSFPSLTYTSNSESKTLYNFDIASTINVFAKGNLDINRIEFFDDNYSWLKVDFAGTTYVRTPYTDGKFYNMSTFEASNPTKSLVTLSQFASLLPSATIQTFKFSLVPILNNITLNASVLNTSLSVLHTTQTTYSTEEGVLIKIPANTSDTNASIYAVKVVIYQYIDNRPQTLYINESQDYFKNIQALTSSTLLNAKYVQYMSSTYLKLSIATPTANRFYKYEVVDNFGEEYSITNIYGSEEIKYELTSSFSINQTYENGYLYYYSTQNVTFKFNSAKDVVK